MAGGSGNGSWLLNGGSKNLPILLICKTVYDYFEQNLNYSENYKHLLNMHLFRYSNSYSDHLQNLAVIDG